MPKNTLSMGAYDRRLKESLATDQTLTGDHIRLGSVRLLHRQKIKFQAVTIMDLKKEPLVIADLDRLIYKYPTSLAILSIVDEDPIKRTEGGLVPTRPPLDYGTQFLQQKQPLKSRIQTRYQSFEFSEVFPGHPPRIAHQIQNAFARGGPSLSRSGTAFISACYAANPGPPFLFWFLSLGPTPASYLPTC
ncbi:hypothetical protein AFLA_001262 [Aspergillus flavus NRRL3357]|nr:hypothetical protein AFLA_001262 [Aspergillus flavus NRRL3357]